MQDIGATRHSIAGHNIADDLDIISQNLLKNIGNSVSESKLTENPTNDLVIILAAILCPFAFGHHNIAHALIDENVQ